MLKVLPGTTGANKEPLFLRVIFFFKVIIDRFYFIFLFQV